MGQSTSAMDTLPPDQFTTAILSDENATIEQWHNLPAPAARDMVARVQSILLASDLQEVHTFTLRQASTILRTAFFPYMESMNVPSNMVKEFIAAEFERVYGARSFGLVRVNGDASSVTSDREQQSNISVIGNTEQPELEWNRWNRRMRAREQRLFDRESQILDIEARRAELENKLQDTKKLRSVRGGAEKKKAELEKIHAEIRNLKVQKGDVELEEILDKEVEKEPARKLVVRLRYRIIS